MHIPAEHFCVSNNLALSVHSLCFFQTQEANHDETSNRVTRNVENGDFPERTRENSTRVRIQEDAQDKDEEANEEGKITFSAITIRGQAKGARLRGDQIGKVLFPEGDSIVDPRDAGILMGNYVRNRQQRAKRMGIFGYFATCNKT